MKPPSPTRKKLVSARTALVLDQPFFGALALRLALREDPGCKTAWVDGRTLAYNPVWLEGLNHEEVVGLVAHEVMHCAAGHPWRRDARDPRKWNVACDLAINQILADAGFRLPPGGLLDSALASGKSAEWIYDRLPEDLDGEGPGEVRDAPDPGQSPGDGDQEVPTEADWQVAVQQAAQAAKMRGKLPAGMERFAAARARSGPDPRSVLARFVQEAARADYSWARPNRRYLAAGLYLPSLWSEELGPIVIAVDTSGSVDDVLLAKFTAWVRAVVEDMRPRRTHVMYADAAVARQQVFERDEPLEIHPAGGGGTDFRPVFQAAAELDEPAICLIYLTDLDGAFPAQAPEYPVLWLTPDPDRRAPFGETVWLEE